MDEYAERVAQLSHAVAALSAKTMVLESLLFSLAGDQCFDKERLRNSFDAFAEMLQSQVLHLPTSDSYVDILQSAIVDARKNLADLE